jgi:hypothetical protein
MAIAAVLVLVVLPRQRAARGDGDEQIVVTPIETSAAKVPPLPDPRPDPPRSPPDEGPGEEPEKQLPAEGPEEGMVGAFVSIHSTPEGALVLIDGRSSGERTAVRGLPLDPGEHVIELTLTGYRGWRKSVIAEPGETLQVRATLKADAAQPGGGDVVGGADAGPEEDYGMLSVDSTPPARVFRQRHELGTTPLRDVELPAGSTTLTFVLASGARHQRTVQVHPGRTTRQRFDFLTPSEGGGDGGGPNVPPEDPARPPATP